MVGSGGNAVASPRLGISVLGGPVGQTPIVGHLAACHRTAQEVRRRHARIRVGYKDLAPRSSPRAPRRQLRQRRVHPHRCRDPFLLPFANPVALRDPPLRRFVLASGHSHAGRRSHSKCSCRPFAYGAPMRKTNRLQGVGTGGSRSRSPLVVRAGSIRRPVGIAAAGSWRCGAGERALQPLCRKNAFRWARCLCTNTVAGEHRGTFGPCVVTHFWATSKAFCSSSGLSSRHGSMQHSPRAPNRTKHSGSSGAAAPCRPPGGFEGPGVGQLGCAVGDGQSGRVPARISLKVCTRSGVGVCGPLEKSDRRGAATRRISRRKVASSDARLNPPAFTSCL